MSITYKISKVLTLMEAPLSRLIRKLLVGIPLLFLVLAPPAATAQKSKPIAFYLDAIQNAAITKGAPDGDALLAFLMTTALSEIPTKAPTGPELKNALLALAYYCDTQGVLERNLLTKRRFRALWTKDQRKQFQPPAARISLRGRHDLALHFTMSLANALLMGDKIASSLGIFKETMDAADLDRGKGSGFSFCDLMANEAGIRLARLAREQPKALRLKGSKNLNRFMPDLKKLPEGLGLKEFKELYGGTNDIRFKKQLEAMRRRINSCPGYPRPKRLSATQRSKTKK